MKKLSILGSTGSIGTQTLEIVKNNPSEFRVAGLTTNNNIELLKKQIQEFKPIAVAVMDEEKADFLKGDININVYSGIGGIIKIAKLNEVDTVVNSLVGSIGVKPTIEAIKNKKNIALANKETLVTAGSIVMEEIKKKNVNKITITASGGPFREFTKKQMENATAKGALKHPTWSMGDKITIDSATLMNKGFEIIEAHWLYNFPYEKIDVVIHPQSIIHSIVEFKDKSVIAQLGNPDMKIPIQYALSYPKRLDSISRKLNLTKIKNLSFEKPDFERFPCLKFAYDAGKEGGTMPAVLNAANEIAVQHFLGNKIKFLDIPKLIGKMMQRHKLIKNPSLNEILDVDKKIKEETKKIIRKIEY